LGEGQDKDVTIKFDLINHSLRMISVPFNFTINTVSFV